MDTCKDNNLIAYITITDDESLNIEKLKTIREYGVFDENIIREFVGTRQSCRKKIEIVKNKLSKEKTIVLFDIHDLGGSYKTILYELQSLHNTKANIAIINNKIKSNSVKLSKDANEILWNTILAIVESLIKPEKKNLLIKQNQGRKVTSKKLGRRGFNVTDEFISYCILWKNKETTIDEILKHFDIKRATFYNYAKKLNEKGLLNMKSEKEIDNKIANSKRCLNEITQMLEVYSDNDVHEKLLISRFNPHKTEKIDIFTRLGKET